jgi:hypothetical protein
MSTAKPVRRSGAEIIAFHFCSDIGEVRDMVYQPTVYRVCRVYTLGDDYYCCPTERQQLPRDARHPTMFDWKPVAAYYGRTIYCSSGTEERA